MKKLLLATLLLVFIAALYLLLWPVPVAPLSWRAPADEGLTGAFSENALLASASGIDLGHHAGPEDAALGRDGHIYATTENGAVLRILPGGRNVRVFADVGGRPLGIERYGDDAFVVANPFAGLQRIDADGSVSTLLSEIDGQPIGYANDVAVAGDGRIFLSNASAKFGAAEFGGTLEASLLDILEHGGNGIVIEYQPASGKARVLLDGLNFANGVAISDDQQFLLVAETGGYRILKHWLEGPDAGTTKVLIDNLPGFPDNINTGMHGRFWVGLAAPRNHLLDRLSSRPLIRKIVQRLPAMMRPQPVPSSHVIAIDAEGTVLMDLQDPGARFPMMTGVLETPKALYLTTLIGHRLPWIEKQYLR